MYMFIGSDSQLKIGQPIMAEKLYKKLFQVPADTQYVYEVDVNGTSNRVFPFRHINKAVHLFSVGYYSRVIDTEYQHIIDGWMASRLEDERINTIVEALPGLDAKVAEAMMEIIDELA